ncbi:hypothetical protein NU688_33040 [Variovorax sp. ZS18.2.2]|uniref:hypothetical protein n=1 Tax=Variovorax sp. ZS18.2.2 TaxID=2971255 RepID=UPI002150FD5D|nr:hypothetical protein [Variovorax sp. ZS18.2.2]MCR6481024.1 hypothetical protein [Variovorax sp. ZS18.2.2]
MSMNGHQPHVSATPHAKTLPFANLVKAVMGDPLPVPTGPHGTRHSPDQLPRGFNDADLALIRKIGAFMPAPKLLGVLNDRLVSDLGPDEEPYTLEQLNTTIKEVHGGSNPALLGRDWPSVRKLLAHARRAGVLEQINEQVINDFAVVFQLNAKQVVELKDIVLGAKED